MLAIYNADVSMEHKAPNTSSYTRKKETKGKNPRAKSGHRKQPTSFKHHSLSNIEETKCGSYKASTRSKTSNLVKEIQSSLVLDTNPSQPPASTPIVVGLHKEDQQAISGPTSLEVTSEGANPQLNSEHDVLAKFIARADSGLSTPKDSISQTIGNNDRPNKLSLDHTFAGTRPHEIKLEYILRLLQDVGVDFMDLDLPNDDEPIIVQDESDEEVHAEKIQPKEPKETKYESAQPTFLNMQQLTKLLVKSLQHELSKILSTHDFSSSLPTKLKELPSIFNKLSRKVKELKKHVIDLKIEMPEDLKEIPTKVENFTLTGESLTTQVAKLKTLQWELLAEFLSIPTQVESIQTKIKTLDALLIQLNRVTKALIKLAQEHKRVEESTTAKAAKHEMEVRREELVDLLGPNVVSKYDKTKLQYDKYCDKMMNKRAKSRITNCDVLTKKVPITLKVYRDDGTDEVIPNFKTSDLHLAKGKGHVGEGQGHMGRSGRVCWYYSGACRCTGRGVGEGGLLAGNLVEYEVTGSKKAIAP
nr:hypothetical protein [Tanacetum cinerariifolium]